MVPADSRKISLVPRYSGYYQIVIISIYGAITVYGSTFQMIQFDITLIMQSYNP
jgi:hypothetical protein